MKFKGSMVALVTPFKGGAIDEKSLGSLVEFQMANGTDGIISVGTTGESPTLSHKEHQRAVQVTVEAADGKTPVIAGTGSNNTEEAIQLTKFAKSVGAAAALVVTPYYNKPTQEGLFRHYEAVASSADIPIILYNVPGRTGVSLNPETVARLSKISSIVAIKEATGSMDQASHIRSLCDITILSGDDSLTLPLLALGATGVISVIANIVPKDVSRTIKAFFDGNLSKAEEFHRRLFPLCRAMFIESNPIPVKRAMKMMGLCSDELRLPLCSIQPKNEKLLLQAMKQYGISLKNEG